MLARGNIIQFGINAESELVLPRCGVRTLRDVSLKFIEIQTYQLSNVVTRECH